MNLEQLERFVMNTIDTIFNNPGEYEAEACKSTVAYRFELYRKSIKQREIHRFPSEVFNIPVPKIFHLNKDELAESMTDSDSTTSSSSTIAEITNIDEGEGP